MTTFHHMEQAARSAVPLGHGRLAAGSRLRQLPSRGVVLPFLMPGTVSGFHARTGEI
jgi:hypothetical protein